MSKKTDNGSKGNSGVTLYEQKKTIRNFLNKAEATEKLIAVHPTLSQLPAAKQAAEINRLKEIALVQIDKNPALGECDAFTFFTALRDAVRLGIIPDSTTNEGHLVPYNNTKKNRVDCNFQIGYKGLIKLAMRTGYLAGVEVRKVYKNDSFSYGYGLNPHCDHIPAIGDRGPFEGAYAVVIMKDGRRTFEYISLFEALEHAKKKVHEKAFRYGPWTTDREAMVMKTALRRSLKYCPMSNELDSVVHLDEQFESGMSPRPDIAEPVEVDAEEVSAEEPKDDPAPTDTGEAKSPDPAEKKKKKESDGNTRKFLSESACADLMAHADSVGIGPVKYMKLLDGLGITAVNEVPIGGDKDVLKAIEKAGTK